MKAKKLIILAVVGFVLIFGLSLAATLKGRNYGTLSTKVVPSDSIATLNGKKIAINRAIGVSPGTYKLSVSRSGFETSEQTIIIETKKRIETTAFLNANSAEGRKWQQEHPEEMAEVESHASKMFDETSKNATERTPLLRYLPFTDLEFRIGYGKSVAHPDDPTATAIFVKYWSEEGKTSALEWMRFKGADPDKLEIIYTKVEGFN